MTGRVTMLGISRWSDKGGSYRTVQRFFQTTIPWAQVLWSFFQTQLQEPDVVYVLAGFSRPYMGSPYPVSLSLPYPSLTPKPVVPTQSWLYKSCGVPKKKPLAKKKPNNVKRNRKKGKPRKNQGVPQAARIGIKQKFA